MIEGTGWAGRLKRAIYARMEEVSFRSAVVTAAGVLAITGVGIGLAITSGAGHQAAAAPLRPAAAATPEPAAPSSAAASSPPAAPSPPASPASVAPEAEDQPVTQAPQAEPVSQAAAPPSPAHGWPRRFKSGQRWRSSRPGWFAPFAPARHGTHRH